MLAAPGIAFAVTLVATPVVRTAARHLGILDHPGPRSSHRTPTPRSGGVAILAGTGAALASSAALLTGRPDIVALLGGGVLVALVGLADDRFGLPPLPRLLVQAAAALLVVRATGGLERLPLPAPLDLPLGSAGAVAAVLWVVVVVNFYNFMDGIDGLATLQGAITAGAIALALARRDPAAGLVAAALAGACVGFLPYNRAPATIFLGDAGSGLLGYTLASLALLAPATDRPRLVLLAATSLFLFLADAATCLLRRMTRGERWLEAHRQHLYQRWVRTGVAHGTVAAWLGLGALVLTASALAGWWRQSATWQWISLALGAALMGLEWAVVRRREKGTGAPDVAERSAS